MNDIKITLSASINYSSEEGLLNFQDVTSEKCCRIIDKSVVEQLDENDLKDVIKREMQEGFYYLARKSIEIKERQGSLKASKKELKNRLNKYLEEKFPEYYMPISWHENEDPSIGSFCLKGRSFKPVDINFPGTEYVLTTKYMNMFVPLSDGTWTYEYQCSNYYTEIIEKINPPIPEKDLEEVLAAAEIPIKLRRYKTRSMEDQRYKYTKEYQERLSSED